MADSPNLASLLGLGAVIAAQLAVGAVVGLVLDAQLSTSPIFVLVGLALGIVGAIAFAVSQFRKYLSTDDTDPNADHKPTTK